MDNENTPLPLEPANLRFLRRLVTVLTVVMIGGVIVTVGLLVTRLRSPIAMPLPDQISLPDQTRALSVTYGQNWYGIVTNTDQFLIYDSNGALQKTISLE